VTLPTLISRRRFAHLGAAGAVGLATGFSDKEGVIDPSLSLKSRHLLTLSLKFRSTVERPNEPQELLSITGGHFTGSRLQGVVHAGGGNWLVVQPNEQIEINIRATLQTQSNDLINIWARGIMDNRHYQDGSLTRITPVFQTASLAYAWMNKIVTVGRGKRIQNVDLYEVYEVL
tara:strand:+ start:6689 stop:7210 length:522 start_codon:yes stop_codon:yes gene_type:complete